MQFCAKRRGPARVVRDLYSFVLRDGGRRKRGVKNVYSFVLRDGRAGAGGESGTYTVLCQETEVGLGGGLQGRIQFCTKRRGPARRGVKLLKHMISIWSLKL